MNDFQRRGQTRPSLTAVRARKASQNLILACISTSEVRFLHLHEAFHLADLVQQGYGAILFLASWNTLSEPGHIQASHAHRPRVKLEQDILRSCY